MQQNQTEFDAVENCARKARRQGRGGGRHRGGYGEDESEEKKEEESNTRVGRSLVPRANLTEEAVALCGKNRCRPKVSSQNIPV